MKRQHDFLGFFIALKLIGIYRFYSIFSQDWKHRLLQRCYEEFLGRVSDGVGMSVYMQADFSIEKICWSFLKSEERTLFIHQVKEVVSHLKRYGKRRNILFLGAYGNGNAGDSMLAEISYEYFSKHYGNQFGLFFHSESSADGYNSEWKQTVLPTNGTTIRAGIVNKFDAVFIGPGGILAHPHPPVWDESWPKLIKPPLVIFACGVSNPLPPVLLNLVGSAAVVSGRDLSSVEALRSANLSAFLCPDPVLAKFSDVGVNLNQKEVIGRLFILRGPPTSFHSHIRDQMNENDVVVGMEPLLDVSLKDYFPEIVLESSYKIIAEMISQYESIITERFHGAVLGLKLKKIVYGITRDDNNRGKIVALFKALDIEDYLMTSVWKQSKRPFPYVRVQTALHDMSDLFDDSVRKIFSELRR